MDIMDKMKMDDNWPIAIQLNAFLALRLSSSILTNL